MTITFPDGLPASITSRIEFSPMEDVVLHVLREQLPDTPAYSLIPASPPPLFVLVRRDNAFGDWRGDPRFVDFGHVQVDCFTRDPDGDEKGALVSEAVRVALRDAAVAKVRIPGRGWLHKVTMASEPSRKTDWATATGPVQYADLPAGYFRYETKYRVWVRTKNKN